MVEMHSTSHDKIVMTHSINSKTNKLECNAKYFMIT